MMLKDILNNKYKVDFHEIEEVYTLSTLIQLSKSMKYSRFLDVLDRLKTKELYKSKTGNLIHGQNHVERVLFFTNILALHYNLSDREYKIVMDGACYHDTGRFNDYEDNSHGFASARKLDKILKNDSFYQEKDNMNIVKTIVDFHSMEDYRENTQDVLQDMMEYYKVEDKELCRKLAAILKDADALDRVRFLETDDAYLKVDCLRLDYSKMLFHAAKELVQVYAYPKVEAYVHVEKVEEKEERVKKEDLHKNDDKNIFGCLHGIGWDFFKLESILKHGILSPSECKKEEVITSLNYDLECKDYVHIVPDCVVSDKRNTAYAKFIKKGISFYALVDKIVEGLPFSRREEAIERKLPILRGEYEDEAYVKTKIGIDSIEYVMIDEKYKNHELNTLEYFNCNMTPKIMGEKARYYIENLKNNLGYEVNSQEIMTVIEVYNDVFVANKITKDVEALNRKSEYLKGMMNQIVGGYMQEAYSRVLKEEATVGKVVEYIVSKTREDYKIIENDQVMVKVK